MIMQCVGELKVMTKAKREKSIQATKLPLPKKAIHNFLREYNYNQHRLSETLGISQPQVSLIVSGKRRFLISPKILGRLPASTELKRKLINWGVQTLLKDNPQAAFSYLPASFVEQNFAPIANCVSMVLETALLEASAQFKPEIAL